MGNNFAPLIADMFIFCYERDFMTSLSNDTQAEVLKLFPHRLDIWTTF